MNLKEFISETLTEIIECVSDAQSNTKGKKTFINMRNFVTQNINNVDFDIAVTVTETTEKKKGAGLSLFVMGYF